MADPGTRRHRAAITEMRPVLYISALEGAVESRNRVLEDQLHVTVRDGGREMPERSFSSSSFLPLPFFLSSSLENSPARILVCVSNVAGSRYGDKAT